MTAAVVKLNSLTNSVRTAAQNHNLLIHKDEEGGGKKAFPLGSAASRSTSVKVNFATCSALSRLHHTPFS